MKGSLADVSVSNVSNIFCSKKSLDVFTKDDYVYSVDIVMSEALIAGIVTVAVVYGPALIPIVTAVANRFGQYSVHRRIERLPENIHRRATTGHCIAHYDESHGRNAAFQSFFARTPIIYRQSGKNKNRRP
jgi:hypothetical protein